MRSLIAAALEDITGWETVEAANGFEALKRLPTCHFDVVITDINMPDINGLEIVRFIKQSDTYQRIPVVIVTTEKAVEDREKGLALGASAYVTKPFRPEELRSVIMEVVERAYGMPQ